MTTINNSRTNTLVFSKPFISLLEQNYIIFRLRKKFKTIILGYANLKKQITEKFKSSYTYLIVYKMNSESSFNSMGGLNFGAISIFIKIYLIAQQLFYSFTI